LLSTLLRVAEAEGIVRLRRSSNRTAATRAYAGVVKQARRREFFTFYGVPDTLDGRFELVCLHAFFYLHRLKGAADAAPVGQVFFDTMFADFDRSLREIGTGDLSVGRQVKRMAEAFYGRIRAYEEGLAGDDAALGAALARNLYGTAPPGPEQVAQMAAYMRREAARLAGEPAAALIAGTVKFGAP
jgi:cytochrome b pre-mRNA-processing protein 3